MFKKIALTVAGFGAMCMFGAGAASADYGDPPPAPTGDDISSRLSTGNERMGMSIGEDGLAVWSMGRRFQINGSTVSRTQITTPMMRYDATTDYNYEGGFQGWQKSESPMMSLDRWFEYVPGEGYQSHVTRRIGSMQYECVNGMCRMVN